MPKLVDPAHRKSTILATRLDQHDAYKLQQVLEYHQVVPSDMVRFLVRREYHRIQGLLQLKPKQEAARPRRRR